MRDSHLYLEAFHDYGWNLVYDWAGDIMHEEREPELHRFVVKLVSGWDPDIAEESEPDFPAVMMHARNFCSINMVGTLKLPAITRVVVSALAAVDAGRLSGPVPRGEPDPEAKSQLWIPRLLPDGTQARCLIDNWRKGQPGQPDQVEAPAFDLWKRPKIRFHPSTLTAHADEAELAMRVDPDGEPVFSHAGAYAVIRQRAVSSVREAQSGETSAVIIHLDAASLRERLMASAGFYVMKGKDYVSDAPAPMLVETLVSRRGGEAPPLVGLLQAPTVLPDGRVIAQPGYDSETGLYAAFGAGVFPAVRCYDIRDLKPLDIFCDEADEANHRRVAAECELAKRHATEAREWIDREWLGEFSFATKLDASAAVAGAMTAVVRPVCGLAPAFNVSGAAVGSGKTTLSLAMAAPASGSVPAVLNWPEKEEEMRKVVTSVLVSGRRALTFDNLRDGATVESVTVAKLLTSETIEDRLLSRNTLATVSTAVFVALSGNNLILSGDMASRTIGIYLDAKVENPAGRTFKRDVLRWTTENRGEIVAKLLTIVKAYLDSGAPLQGGHATRFATWDRMVRQAIMWAGGEDVGQKIADAQQDDPDSQALAALMDAWCFTEPVTAGEIGDAIEGAAIKGTSDEEHQALVKAVRMLAGSLPRQQVDPRKIGLTLKKYANRRVGNRRITSTYDGHKKQHRWQIEACG